MSQLLEVTPEGLFCPPGRFHIDPWRPVERAVITHAHSDHARGGSRAYLAAHSGAPFLRGRLGMDLPLETVGWGEERRMEGVSVSLHPAGHIRGSAQVRVEYRGEVWVVSGDYKLQRDATAEAFEPVPCHTFISECTFGLPVYRWPGPEQVAEEMKEWWAENRARGRTSVLFAYSLGKAQRALSLLDPEAGPILAHGAIRRMTDLYRQEGLDLPPLGEANRQTVRAAEGGALVLAPPSAAGGSWLRSLGATSTAFASGWMRIRGTRRRRGADRGFVLSDHADWDGLLQAIEATGASRVDLTHGTTTAMTRYLRERGVDARALATPFQGEGGAESPDDAESRDEVASPEGADSGSATSPGEGERSAGAAGEASVEAPTPGKDA
jgi:putative mRNA 3-end processing factor